MGSMAMHEEHQYLDLIREILETGEKRPDRYVHDLILLSNIFLMTDQHWNRNNINIRTTPPKIHTQQEQPTNPPAPYNKTGLHARNHRRTTLVHRRQHLLVSPQRRRRQDLGRQWIPRIPRQQRPVPSRSRRSRPSIRLPMATFRRRIQRFENRLYRTGSRSISRDNP